MSQEIKHIWFSKTSDNITFYGIPENVLFLPGDYRLERMDGVVRMIRPEELEQYGIGQADAEKELKNTYEEAMKVAKEQLGHLARFAEITGKTDRFDKLVDSMEIPKGAEDIQTFVQQFFGKMQQPSSETEQEQLFKETFGKVPEIAAFFDERSLENAARDPEAWANEMYKTLFGEEESKRQKEKQEHLKETISEQLRKNIEEAEKKYRK